MTCLSDSAQSRRSLYLKAQTLYLGIRTALGLILGKYYVYLVSGNTIYNCCRRRVIL